MTNANARDFFKHSGLSYKDIGSREIALLRKLIEVKLKDFNNDGFSMKLKKGFSFSYDENGSLSHGFFKVKGNYFDKREAISFNKDGFIGFAGWASRENASPFLDAFIEWVQKIKNNE